QHLVIKDEIVAVLVLRQLLQHIAGKRPVAGVEFRYFRMHQDVLKKRKEAIRDVFVYRHAPADRRAAEDTRGQDDVVLPGRDHGCHRDDELGGVLIVGMEHDHHVGAKLEGFLIAGLLVRPIAAVLRVADGVQAHLLGDLKRVVAAEIVHEDDLIDITGTDVRHLFFHATGGVIGGDYYDKTFARNHRVEQYQPEGQSDPLNVSRT